jgi:hypothetical protein
VTAVAVIISVTSQKMAVCRAYLVYDKDQMKVETVSHTFEFCRSMKCLDQFSDYALLMESSISWSYTFHVTLL